MLIHTLHVHVCQCTLCRLVEEVKDAAEVELETDDVYMNPSFQEFTRQVVLKSRGGEDSTFEYHPVRGGSPTCQTTPLSSTSVFPRVSKYPVSLFSLYIGIPCPCSLPVPL